MTVTKTEIQKETGVFETSPNQKSIYAINQLDPLSTSYNITQTLIVTQALDKERLFEITKKVVHKYEALKASFHMQNGELIQKVHSEIEFDFDYKTVDSEDDVNAVIDGFVKGFDLSIPKLLRFLLIRVSEKRYYFILDIHHIIADGISVVMLIHEILEENIGISHKECRYNQTDVIALKKKELLQNGEKYKEYWEEKFRSDVPIIDLPFDRGLLSIETNKAGRKIFTTSKDLTEALKRTAKDNHVTLFCLLLSAFYVFLNKLTGQDDIVIGVPIAGRNLSAARKTIGMFVNTVPFRLNFKDNDSLETLTKGITDELNQVMKYQDYPMDDLINGLNLKKEVNRNFLFDVLFSYYSKKFGSKIENVEKSLYKNSDAQFFLSMNVEDGVESLSIELEYYKDLFDETTIMRFGERFVTLLVMLSKNKNQKLKDLSLLSHEERDIVLNKFNETDLSFDYNKPVYQMVEENADRLPNKTAVIFDDKAITYKQINEMGNKIAHILLERGLNEDNCIGIFMERSDQMLETILGIWKAGGAYIPIDTAYPMDRIADIYEASQAKYMITLTKFVTPEIRERLKEVQIICLDEIDLSLYPTGNIGKSYAYRCLSYIIFTSGSTGKPKGAMVEQVGMTNHMLAKKNDLCLNEESIVVQNASQCFDISVWQFFNALIVGGTTLILSNDKVMDINLFLEYIDKNKVTILEVVPSYLSIMIEKLKEGSHLKELKYLLITGEKVNSDLVKKWFELDNKIKMVNAYGPTEASDDITHYIMSENPDVMNISVGKPIQNMKIYIVDKNENLCGIGIKGEIYVSGIGVGRGYIGDEKKTKEVFSVDPFHPSEKMYKTGDIGRWLPDGNIEYLERKDYQVKIRGYRIELGEIESKLLEISNIERAVVLDRVDRNKEKFLCAYIVTLGHIDVEEIKGKLSKNLPYYMIPDHIVEMDSIPITSNGKTDRKKLVEIPIEIKEKRIQKPKTWIQKKLALIWCEILEVETVGIDERFFELFGHSLKAIKMADLIKDEFGVQFKVEDIFNNDTIRKQEKIIEKKKNTNEKRIKKAENRNGFQISSAQNRIFSACQSSGDETAYNMPGLFEIHGDIEKENVQEIFGKILERHSNLRANFKVEGNEIVQYIRQYETFKVSEIHGDEFDVSEIIDECVYPFDLENDVLLRVAIIYSADKKKYLFIDMHHIISDGISMEIIVKEFIKLYHGSELSLPEYEYADYVLWQQERRDSLVEQKAYWLQEFQDGIPELDLVSDFKRPAIASYSGKNQMMVIGSEMLQQLKRMAIQADSTLHMVLMGAYKILLSKYTGKTDIVVGTVSAGRGETEFREIIGMFVNTLPIRTKQEQDKSFGYFLKEIKKKMLNALQNEEYPFDELVKDLNLQRNMSRNPMFDTLFVMQDDYVDEINAGSLLLKTIEYPKRTSKFDIEFQAYENNNQLVLDMSFKDSLFNKNTIETMLNRYKHILEQIISNPEILLKEIGITMESDLKKNLEFHSSNGDYDIDLSLVDLFEEKVYISPYHTALILDDKKMSYNELNNRANQLAKILREYGVRAGSRVAIIMDDCFEMVESILAILKLGAVYVPVDPNFPEGRVQMMIEDSKAQLLLLNEVENEKYNELVPILNISNCFITNDRTTDISCNVGGNDIACIVYTSGTTGVPKGNLVLHKNIVRVVYNTNYVEFDSNDTVLQTAHYGFDGSFFNIFGALLNGSKLVLCSRKNLLDLDYIAHLIEDKKISIFFATTSLFNVWVESIGAAFKNVRCIVFGGEKASEKHCRMALEYLEEGHLINGYGPTESTVFATAYQMKEQKDIIPNIPIGKVITNTSIHILGINNQINPVGIPGELCIAGHGLVAGYTNSPELMEKKFIMNPHNKEELLYRTGDLALWKEDGNIQFLGRADNQVKVNGYRIELEEIEAVLHQHNDIKEVAVMLKVSRSNMKAIVAFYTSEKELSGKDLINWMKKLVPQYMLPKHFIKVEIMPLNQNGKIDRKVLRKFEIFENVEITNKIKQNLTKIQKALLDVCGAILGIGHLKLEDDFYEKGGDSVKAIQLSAALKKSKLIISTKDILLNPIMSELAELIQYEKNTKIYEKVVGEVKLLPVYQFFIERNEDLNHFSQSVLLYSKEDIQLEKMNRVFQNLIKSHDMLRAAYHKNILFCKDVDEKNLFEIKEYNFRMHDNWEERVREKIYDIKSSTNLAEGPILKGALFQTGEGTHFLICIHHFAVDTVSWRIILDDVLTSYAELNYSEVDQQLIRTNSFQDWSERIYKYAQSKEFEVEKDYWSNLDEKKLYNSEILSSVGERIIGKSKKVSKELDREQTDHLLLKTNHAYNTEVRHLLITALGLSMKSVFGIRESLRVLMEGHGREDLFDNIDVSRTVGWFTSLFPVVLDMSVEGIAGQIKMVKENINNVPNKGIGYGIWKYLSDKTRNENTSFWEVVSFNYLGAFDNLMESEEFTLSPIQNEYDQGDQLSMIAKLEITAAIYDGKLNLDILYPTKDYTEEQINQFLEVYIMNIERIIEHCMTKEKTELTLSDFKDKNLSVDDLTAIHKLFA